MCVHVLGVQPEPIYKQVGGIIRALRRRADKAQDDLARDVGISRATLANIETGRQRILVHQLYAFARALNVKLEALLPPLVNEQAAKGWAELNFDSDLNVMQKQQVANLIGSVDGPAISRTLEDSNGKKATPSISGNRGSKPSG